jgi:hypothetical protein
MFKRLFWLVIGIAFGFGMSFWITRMLKETVERYKPERVGSDLAGALRQLGTDIREAVGDGVDGMREHEAELRAQLEPPALRRS